MINIYAPLNTLGYGVHALNWTGALHQLGVELGFRPIGVAGGLQNSFYVDIFNKAIANHPVTDFDAPTIVLWHENDLARYRGTPLIGYTVFETNQLRNNHVYELSQLDAIWVVSHWAKEVLEQYDELKEKVYVVPEGVHAGIYKREKSEEDRELLQGFSEALDEIIGDRYAIVSLGKYEKRKNNDLILELMDKRFKNGITPICLFALWDNPFMPDYGQNIMEHMEGIHYFIDQELSSKAGIPVFNSIAGGHRIVLFPRRLTEIHLAEIYRKSDLGLFPYRSEGWNLPLIECLACGTRCIATNYSGPTEYLPDTDATLIEDFEMVTADDGMWFRGDVGTWPEFSAETLYEISNPIILEGKGIRNKCAETIAQKWSWIEAAKKSIEALNQLDIMTYTGHDVAQVVEDEDETQSS